MCRQLFETGEFLMRSLVHWKNHFLKDFESSLGSSSALLIDLFEVVHLSI